MDDLRAIGRWLGRETRLLSGALVSPGLWAALGAALLLWAAAYQVPAAHTLHVGGDRATRLREYDAPFLSGVNASEPAPAEGEWYAAGAPYRWTMSRAELRLPGAGGGPWAVAALISAGPRAEPLVTTWRISGGPPQSVAILPGEARVYRLLGPSAGELRVNLDAPPLDAPGDPRDLGAVLFRISAVQLGDAPRPPDPTTLALLGVALLGALALAARSGVGRREQWALWLALALGAAWMLAARRVDIAAFAPALAALAWICYLLTALLAALLAAAARRLGVAAGPAESAGAAAAVALGFGARMAGMLHPYAIFSDTGLHLNNLAGLTSQVIGVASGAVLFTEGLPCEAGAGQSPYPPGPYLAAAPGLLVTGGDLEMRRWMLQGGVALAESVGAALLWLLLRRAGLGRWASLAAAALYAAAPPLLRSYSVGEMANLFAQALVPALLLFLAVGAPQARRPAVAALGAALLAVLLLSHTGVTLSTAALLAAWLPLSLARGRLAAPAIRSLALGGVAAGALALGLYYGGYAELFQERRALATAQAALPPEQRCPPERPLPEKLWRWGVGPLIDERPALQGALLVSGAAGALLLLAGQRGARRDAGVVLAAAWVGALLSLGTLLGSDQAVRWQPFLFPALCAGGGVALGAWRRRGTAGRWLALAAVAFLCWYAAADWVRQIATYKH